MLPAVEAAAFIVRVTLLTVWRASRRLGNDNGRPGATVQTATVTTLFRATLFVEVAISVIFFAFLWSGRELLGEGFHELDVVSMASGLQIVSCAVRTYPGLVLV